MARPSKKAAAADKAATNAPATEPVDPLAAFVAAGLNKFETDADLELTKGVDVEVEGVGTFTILRMTLRNKPWTEALRTRYTPYSDSKDEDFKKSIEIGIFADTLIVGLKNAEGKTIPYNEKAKRAVRDLLEKTPDLYEFLERRANNGATFLKKHEAEAKN